jgi:hypothetical protein
MGLPFTVEEFMGVFEKYNVAVWPMQIILVLIAILALFFSLKKFSYSDKMISAFLGFFWLWTGVVYHFTFFTKMLQNAPSCGRG